MTTVTTPPPIETVSGHLYLTRDGERLARNDPDALTHFVHTALAEGCRPAGQETTEVLGSGMDARVVKLPERPSYCVKTSTPWTGEKFHESGVATRPRNLITEMYFMDKVRRLLQKQDSDIHVPALYAACRLPNRTTALLQERLPETATPFAQVNYYDDKLYRRISWALIKRVNIALSGSPLYGGIGDFEQNEDAVHPYNVFLEPSLDPNGQIYLIDLIGRRTMRAAILAQTPRRLLKRPLPI